MCDSKVNLKLSPCPIRDGFPFPNVAVVLEYSCGGKYIERGVDNLHGCEGCITCREKFDGVFDLINESFDWEAHIVWELYPFVIFFEIRRSNICVSSVEMRKYL